MKHFAHFPHVRQAFGMDINRQEYCYVTGLSDMDVVGLPGIVTGEWSNNWVPDGDITK